MAELAERLAPFARAKYDDPDASRRTMSSRCPATPASPTGSPSTTPAASTAGSCACRRRTCAGEGTADMLRQVTALAGARGQRRCRTAPSVGPADRTTSSGSAARTSSSSSCDDGERRRDGRRRRLGQRPRARPAHGDGAPGDGRPRRHPPGRVAGALRLPRRAGRRSPPTSPAGTASSRRPPTLRPSVTSRAASAAARPDADGGPRRAVPRRLPVREPVVLVGRRAARRPRLGAVRHRRDAQRRRLGGHVQRPRGVASTTARSPTACRAPTS